MAQPDGQKRKRTTASLIRENERLRVEIGALRQSRLAANIGMAWRESVRWLGGGFFVWKTAEALAGKTTYVDAAIDVCASLPDILQELAPSWGFQIASGIVVGLAILSNIRYRRLNMKMAKRLGVIVPKYEALVDPTRSSSGLGLDGQTNEKDDI